MIDVCTIKYKLIDNTYMTTIGSLLQWSIKIFINRIDFSSSRKQKSNKIQVISCRCPMQRGDANSISTYNQFWICTNQFRYSIQITASTRFFHTFRRPYLMNLRHRTINICIVNNFLMLSNIA